MTAKPLARHELLAEEQPESTQTAPAAPLNRDSAEWRIGEGGATSREGDPSTAIEKVESPLTYSPFDPSPRPLETSTNGFRYCPTCEAPGSVAPGHVCIPAPRATV